MLTFIPLILSVVLGIAGVSSTSRWETSPVTGQAAAASVAARRGGGVSGRDAPRRVPGGGLWRRAPTEEKTDDAYDDI